jgi:hypothetical protein
MGARAVLAILAWLASATASAAEPFRFDSVTSVDDMRAFVQARLSAHPARDEVRALFVGEGGATQVAHPKRGDVEKYLYDINLCGYYVWRWNISADYDGRDHLKQIYVNAEPVLNGAKPDAMPMRGPFHQITRRRPEAAKGESSLAAIVTDRDGDLRTTYDEQIMTGVGPTRVDPLNMGSAYPYHGEVWRSIFDPDPANSIASWRGDCAAVDAAMAALKARAAAAGPPPPTAMTEAAISSWLTANIHAEGWTLIAMAVPEAVVFGGPEGVAVLPDGTMATLIRNEYFQPAQFGAQQVRSTAQHWNIDCAGKRLRILDMAIFSQNNLSGSSSKRTLENPEWTPIAESDAVRTRILKRVCEAPTTGTLRH